MIREERQRAEEGKEKFIDIKETKEVSEERRDSVMKTYVEFRETIILYNEEFDPGSGWTLAAGLTHASRGAAGCSNTLPATGGWVRNAYATYLIQGDNLSKGRLTPHSII